MRKGTVLSIENDVAIVFTDDCGLVRVPCRPDMAIGREIVLADAVVEPVRRPVTQIRFWKPAMAATIFLIIVTVGLWFGQGRWPLAAYARLSVEVNPGIELVLDRRLQVRDVLLFDEEARQLAAGVQLEGLEWRDAIGLWAGVLNEKRPEKLERMLLAATLSQRDEAFLAQLREMSGTDNPGVLAGVDVRVLYATDPDVARLAEINGLTVGRQMILNQVLDQQWDWGAAQIATAPLVELVGLLSKDLDPDQDPVMDRIRERNATRTSSGATTGQTTGKTSTGNTSGGMTSGQTTGKTTGSLTEESVTKGSTTGGSTTKESSSGQTTGSTSGKTTSGSGTGTTATQSQTGETVTGSSSSVGGTTNASIPTASQTAQPSPSGNEPGKTT